MRKTDTSPRQLMELAIEVMRQSIPEPRSDGKASPKVGAVLFKPDGTVETASRGELRHGDHAEYTLLERKNRDQNLAGGTLFATLEPCAPNARRHPKLGCAERIVLARIKEVWIGIEDPDPTVDRKGIKYLQDNGIAVHMFPRELQDIIQAENKEFIAQALERAAAAEVKAPEVILSPLEGPIPSVQMDALSIPALEAYRANAEISEPVDSLAFRNHLVRLGVLQPQGNDFVPTGFGVILFDKDPGTALPQARLLGTIHQPDNKEEIRDFEGPQVFAPEEAIQWLRDKLPNPIDRSQAQRSEINTPLFELVREGIVNALVHRDYSITGAKCQLKVWADKIEIWSPGGPTPPITLEQIQAFNAPMLSRNPILHNVFARMTLAEERGIGLVSMRSRAEHERLPLPRYTWNNPYLVLTLFPSSASVFVSLPVNIQNMLTEAERVGWQWLSTKSRAKSSDYAEAMNLDERSARRHLNRFVELNLARKIGSARSTVYEPI